MMGDPQWLIAILVIVGQVATAVAVVFSLRGEVRRTEQIALDARKTANEAHGRIDRHINRRYEYGTSQA